MSASLSFLIGHRVRGASFLPPALGIFAFKCSRAEEIFNLLQDLMQCNSINVMEEPVIITRNSHPAEIDLPRAPQPPNGEESPFLSTPIYTYMRTSTGPESTSLGGMNQAGRSGDGWVSQPSRTSIHHQNHLWDG